MHYLSFIVASFMLGSTFLELVPIARVAITAMKDKEIGIVNRFMLGIVPLMILIAELSVFSWWAGWAWGQLGF